jgi:Holliday junction DNA helicase RuvA
MRVFNSISGQISFKNEESIYISNNGIEWEIRATLQSLKDFGAVGQNAKVFVFLYHRDDQMRLYGFATEKERALFIDLLKVEGLGPRIAIKLLGAITAADFIEALEREDLGTLSSLPGVGKKTAGKIILALQGKLETFRNKNESSRVNEDIINALIGMGFDKRISREAVNSALKELQPQVKEMSREELDKELFTKALAIASRKKA